MIVNIKQWHTGCPSCSAEGLIVLFINSTDGFIIHDPIGEYKTGETFSDWVRASSEHWRNPDPNHPEIKLTFKNGVMSIDLQQEPELALVEDKRKIQL